MARRPSVPLVQERSQLPDHIVAEIVHRFCRSGEPLRRVRRANGKGLRGLALEGFAKLLDQLVEGFARLDSGAKAGFGGREVAPPSHQQVHNGWGKPDCPGYRRANLSICIVPSSGSFKAALRKFLGFNCHCPRLIEGVHWIGAHLAHPTTVGAS